MSGKTEWSLKKMSYEDAAVLIYELLEGKERLHNTAVPAQGEADAAPSSGTASAVVPVMKEPPYQVPAAVSVQSVLVPTSITEDLSSRAAAMSQSTQNLPWAVGNTSIKIQILGRILRPASPQPSQGPAWVAGDLGFWVSSPRATPTFCGPG